MTINVDFLATQISAWAWELGFQGVGITDTHLPEAEIHLQQWLTNNHHGAMSYMAHHGSKRSRPQELLPGTLRVISVRMNYWPQESVQEAVQQLENPEHGFISRYALGRDYHKLVRKRLQALADRISETVKEHHYRVYCDSAPVLEKALAEKSGLGWIGKHTNVINSKAGSWFFLGEIYTDIPLPIDSPAQNHCGSCSACIDVCPTAAIIGPYQLDARRCISYLTIELRDAIPEELRPLLGNRIYGCDDCQLVCPWNKFSQKTAEGDFLARHNLDSESLLSLWSWTEQEFLGKTEGSAIRRIGYDCWTRNLAVALGNAPASDKIIQALSSRLNNAPPMVAEHILWAIKQQQVRLAR